MGIWNTIIRRLIKVHRIAFTLVKKAVKLIFIILVHASIYLQITLFAATGAGFILARGVLVV